MKQKETFKHIFLGFSIIIMLLPLFAALNSFLTQGLNKAGWYKPIQRYVVPWQARLVSVSIAPFGIESRVTPNDRLSAFYMIKNGAAIPVDLSWNCLGWQSLLLFILSLVIGLRGSYTNLSRIKIIIFGLLGTLLINVFRMSLIAIGIYYVNSLAAQIVHDYFAAFLTLIWLIFFWWFSYRYVLEVSSESSPTNLTFNI